MFNNSSLFYIKLSPNIYSIKINFFFFTSFF
nr:MAG TPA: hypothetical protein [Caudoviricetes sp.]